MKDTVLDIVVKNIFLDCRDRDVAGDSVQHVLARHPRLLAAAANEILIRSRLLRWKIASIRSCATKISPDKYVLSSNLAKSSPSNGHPVRKKPHAPNTFCKKRYESIPY